MVHTRELLAHRMQLQAQYQLILSANYGTCPPTAARAFPDLEIHDRAIGPERHTRAHARGEHGLQHARDVREILISHRLDERKPERHARDRAREFADFCDALVAKRAASVR